MNSMDISEALGYLSDDMLTEAREYKAPVGRKRMVRLLACAACICVIAAVVLRFELPADKVAGTPPETPGAAPANRPAEEPAEAPPNSSEGSADGTLSPGFVLPENYEPTQPRPDYGTVKGLPVLAPSGDQHGMGFEGLLAYDISELMPVSPLGDGAGVETLPAYRNPLWIEGRDPETCAPVFCGIDWEKMMDTLLDAAALFGYGEAELSFRAGEQSLFGSNAKVSIEVGSDMLVRVQFLQPEYLDGASMSYYTELNGVEFCAEYLLENYAHLLDMEKPGYIITGGDYTIHGQQGYDVIFYDTAGTPEQQLQNRYFRYAEFKFDENGKLWFFNTKHSDLSEKLGDYPIITAEEALERLAAGEYITSVSYDFPGAEYAVRTELVYRVDSAWGGDYMPYYRILVELPELEGMHMELKTYGAYYVPAVESEYLTDARTWNGEFNI